MLWQPPQPHPKCKCVVHIMYFIHLTGSIYILSPLYLSKWASNSLLPQTLFKWHAAPLSDKCNAQLLFLGSLELTAKVKLSLRSPSFILSFYNFLSYFYKCSKTHATDSCRWHSLILSQHMSCQGKNVIALCTVTNVNK